MDVLGAPGPCLTPRPYLGKHHDDNGQAGDPVVWEPFGGIKSTHLVGIRVCLVDGAGDTTPSYCGSAQQQISG
ncbi:hypothetical protein [Streptomyces sp. NPDC054804]